MSPLLMSVIAFACVLGGTFLGIFLRNRLPEHHLSAATKDVARLGRMNWDNRRSCARIVDCLRRIAPMKLRAVKFSS